LFVFIIYNSSILAKKAGNKNLFEAYQRRLSRTQISILACVVLLLIFVGLRVQSGCDTLLNAVISVGLGSGLGIAYWHILDICNTQLHSDILGITRNMAPLSDNQEVAVVCTA
jgi:Na+/pantothenate symporter